MNPLPDTILALKAGPYERHYTTYRHNRFRHWKIGDEGIQRSVSFLTYHVFNPSRHIESKDIELLPKNALIQYCGKFRFIQLSEYIFETGQEVFFSFFMSDFYVIHPYRYYTHTISFERWMTKRSDWHLVNHFPDLRNRVSIDYRILQRLLFSIHVMDNKLEKIP